LMICLFLNGGWHSAMAAELIYKFNTECNGQASMHILLF